MEHKEYSLYKWSHSWTEARYSYLLKPEFKQKGHYTGQEIRTGFSCSFLRIKLKINSLLNFISLNYIKKYTHALGHTWHLVEKKQFQLKIMSKWFQLKSLHKWLTLNPWAIFPIEVLRADAIKEGLNSPHPSKDAEAEWTKHQHNCKGRV